MTDGGGVRSEGLASTLTFRSTEIYLLGQVIDLATTWWLTPDLSGEANVIIARYGLGWSDILLVAFLTTVVLLLVLSWMWRGVVDRFPGCRVGYGRFYSHILLGTSTGTRGDYKAVWVGALLGMACIIAYTVITSKLLTCAWNLVILVTGTPAFSITHFVLVRHVLAACAGLGMYFIFPYRVHQRIHRLSGTA